MYDYNIVWNRPRYLFSEHVQLVIRESGVDVFAEALPGIGEGFPLQPGAVLRGRDWGCGQLGLTMAT